MTPNATASPAPASPADSKLAPDTADIQTTLTSSLNANTVVTGYCHALLNTIIQPIPGVQNPPPDWLAQLQTNLQIAQGHAGIWLGTKEKPGGLSSLVFAQVPQSIINYSDIFTTATNDVLDILSKISGPVQPADQQKIIELLSATMGQLDTTSATLTDILAQIQAFASDIQTDNTNLVNGQNGAAKALAIDNNQITTINAKINEIQAKIKADSQKALMSEIGLGVAIFITIAAVALAVATEGAAAPLIVAGVAVLGVGGAIAGTVIFSKDVQNDLNDLYEQQAELTAEQQQVTALTGITNSIQSLIDSNKQAEDAITSILKTWTTLQAKLNSVIQDLESAEASNLPGIIETLDIQTAQTAWGQLTTFCTAMQNSASSIQVNNVQTPGQSGTAAA